MTSYFAIKARAEARSRAELYMWEQSKPEFPRWYLLACKIPARWTPRFLDNKMADCYNDMMEAYRQWQSERP
jgi:hypothetical protein